MIKLIQKIYHLVGTFLAIARLDFKKNLRRKIRKTWIRIFCLALYDGKNKMANIAGFNVKFLDFQILSFLFKEIFLENLYHFVADNKSPFIIDCGSNIGMSILYFKMLYPDSQILAFEPGEETYLCLKENIKNNNLNSVSMHKCALSNKEGFVDFYYDKERLGRLSMSTKPGRMPLQKSQVKSAVLSKYIDKDVDFLKVDIEGAEIEVIEELISAKKISYIKQMVIEYHHHVVGDSDIFSQMLILLETAGFGYQIESRLGRPFMRKQFQDILVYAYRKNMAK